MDQAAQAQQAQNVVVQPGPAGQLNLKIEQSKLPIFYGIRTKDTITAAHMIERVEALQATNAWSNEDTYHHFSLALQGSAQEWLRTQQHLQENPAKTWTFIMPLFRSNFAAQEDDSALLDQLRTIAMKGQENITDYGNRVSRLIELLTDKFDTPARPAAAAANAYTDAEVDAIRLSDKKAMFRYMALQIFRAGLPKDLRAVVSQQKPTTFGRAFEIARDQIQIVDPHKTVAPIEEDQADIDAVQFRPQGQRNNWNRKPNFNNNPNNNYNRAPSNQQPRQPSNNSTNYRGPGNNSNNNSRIICVYCKKPNHHQDQCRKRIVDKQPCVSNSGKTYWPRTVNAVDTADTLPDINTINFGPSGFPYRA